MAERKPADLGCRGYVGLDERRRGVQRAGDVVEAVAGVVDGQERSGIDLQPEQVANRVRILTAVQPVRPRRCVRRLLGRRAVQLPFQRAREEIDARRVGTGHVRRRHHSGAQLADDLLAELPVIDVIDAARDG